MNLLPCSDFISKLSGQILSPKERFCAKHLSGFTPLLMKHVQQRRRYTSPAANMIAQFYWNRWQVKLLSSYQSEPVIIIYLILKIILAFHFEVHMTQTKAITVVYLSDQKFYYDTFGNWFTTASFPLSEIAKAFPANLNRWIFFGRLLTLPYHNEGFFPIDVPLGMKVEFQGPIFPISGIDGFIKHLPKYYDSVRTCVKEADIVWAKLPYIATLLALHRKNDSAFVVSHMVGDPGDTLELRGGMFWRLFARLSRWLNRRALKNADVCLFVSKALQDRYAYPNKINASIHEGRVSRKHLVEHFLSDKKVPNVVLYVGRLSKEKGIDVLITAFAAAIKKINIKLRIIGDGNEKKNLQHLSCILGVEKEITFVGKITWGKNLFDEMRSATCLVLPSFTEGLPLVLHESLSQGTPVIASDVGGVSEALGVDKAGILVPAGDSFYLANEIVRLVTDLELQEHLKEMGLRHIADNTLECQVIRLRHIFTELYEQQITNELVI